jgi:alkylation response protein AidB-like acyl-CoA dehydrogenase
VDRADEAHRHLGLAIPEEYGGTPVSMPCYVLVTQELARGWMSLAGAMGGHTVVAKLLALFGTEEQKRHYLPSMATGAVRATMALTDPAVAAICRTCRPPRCRTAPTNWWSTDRRPGSAMPAGQD